MQDILKDYRKQIDALIIVTTSELRGSREISLVATNLQRSQMFLGLVLGSVSSATPYPEANNFKNNVIADRADQADFKIEFPKDVFHTHTMLGEGSLTSSTDFSFEVPKIKYLRNYIQELLDKAEAEITEFCDDDDNALVIVELDWDSLSTASSALKESKMWLGQQLNNIKLNDDQYQKDLANFEGYKLIEAEEAYSRYGKVTDFKNFRGDTMPSFSELPFKIQEAWKAAVSKFVHPPENANNPRGITSSGRRSY